MQSLPFGSVRAALCATSALVRPSLAVLCFTPFFVTAAAAQTAPDLPTVVVQPSLPDGGGASFGAFAPANSAAISGGGAAAAELWSSDSASLITDIPGGATWGAGGVSSLPTVNGMGADRVQVTINSMLFAPACPNQMNPPLSFVNPAMISNMRVYTASSPVSAGGDYTGARVEVAVAPPIFASNGGFITTGGVSGFFRSNGSSYGVNANTTVSNLDTSVAFTGGWARSGDYTAGDGTKIKSTLFQTQNYALSVSKKVQDGLFSIEVGGQAIPYQGYPNQYMDMVDNHSLYINARYEGLFDWGKFEATAFGNRIRHTMGFIEPDKSGDMPMDTQSMDAGYTVKGTIRISAQDLVRIGNELYYNHLDDWWPPVSGSAMMGPDTFVNINNGQRGRVGTFAEWERRWDPAWTTIFGVRNDVVMMNTGDVQGYNAMMYGAEAAAFNAQDRARTDVNFDGSALVRYEADPSSLYELGFARKTRSPNLYERYAWSTNAMAMQMIGWFGDGNGYVGNINLVPEKANTVSFTAAWHDAARKAWEIRVSPYYSYVEDYIDADRCALSGCLANLASNLTTTDNFVYLQFANHDAWLYGVNLDGKLALWDTDTFGQGGFRGNLNFVRGQRTDGINLYHMMPVNATLALDQTFGGWNSSLEVQFVGSKTLVSQVRNELVTSSYALVNLRLGYQWEAVRLDFGIDNLFNQNYDLPLGGANLVNYQAVSMMGTSAVYGYPVAGPGRSFNTRLSVKF
ncbi:TonB-dependent receptor [Methylocella silvestris]|uniref:TonB-dependent receptor n=1 Tax=Methylocella silvestris TaxID=199596 RepID=A0A2J7TGH3_METSI|nr:TonB-dependent receptor plug domain-containing protein [Methylocella silvestris]PNG25872.1 TonB-dependent receptor [Methylocella silvestris]